MGGRTRVLITGGAGFIGRRTAQFLVNHGFEVSILDSRITEKKHLLERLDGDVKWIEGDVKDKQVVFDSIRGRDTVIHLAAGCSFLMYEERPVAETVNVIHGFLNVLEAVRHHNVGKLVYASTSAVYEGNPLPYNEGMNLSPPDHKALAKKVIEELAGLYSRRYGIRTVGVRPFSVYGDGETDKGGIANIISLFTWAMLAGNRPVVWGDGTQTRDFIYVDDLAEILHRCIVRDFDEQIVNAGTGTETSFNRIISVINEHLDVPLEPVYVPVPIPIYAPRLWANTLRQERLGLETRIGIEEGIARVVKSVRSLGEFLRRGLADAQWRYTPIENQQTGR